MVELKTAQYIRTRTTRPSRHEAVTAPIPIMKSDENYGDLGFNMYWKCISKPYVDESTPHRHDFNHFLVFLGGDPYNMLDLGGEVEFTLSEDGVNLEKHVFTKYTTVFVKVGLYHCPLVFTKVNKPFIFYDIVFTRQYSRLS
jgi:hypothetical protein